MKLKSLLLTGAILVSGAVSANAQYYPPWYQRGLQVQQQLVQQYPPVTVGPITCPNVPMQLRPIAGPGSDCWQRQEEWEMNQNNTPLTSRWFANQRIDPNEIGPWYQTCPADVQRSGGPPPYKILWDTVFSHKTCYSMHELTELPRTLVWSLAQLDRYHASQEYADELQHNREVAGYIGNILKDLQVIQEQDKIYTCQYYPKLSMCKDLDK